MEKLHFRGSWPRIINKVISAYPELERERTTYIRGKKDQVLDKLERETGKGREELISWMTGLSRLTL